MKFLPLYCVCVSENITRLLCLLNSTYGPEQGFHSKMHLDRFKADVEETSTDSTYWICCKARADKPQKIVADCTIKKKKVCHPTKFDNLIMP